MRPRTSLAGVPPFKLRRGDAAQKKKAPRSFEAGRSAKAAARSVVGAGKGGADRGKGLGELRADRRDGGDDHDRDERGDEPVFNGGAAAFILEEGHEGARLPSPRLTTALSPSPRLIRCKGYPDCRIAVA